MYSHCPGIKIVIKNSNYFNIVEVEKGDAVRVGGY